MSDLLVSSPLSSESAPSPRPTKGDFLKGRVLAIEEQGVKIHVGEWASVIPHAEWDELRADGHQLLADQEVPVVVLNPNGPQGQLLVSVLQGFRQVDWARAEQLRASGELWEGRVTGHNRGGLIVPFGHLKAFVPASHIIDLPPHLDEGERLNRLKALVGKTLGFKVIEADRQQWRVLLSQRNAQKAFREKQKARLLTDLAEGQVREGVITGLRDFGAFVDLGGADGLVHVSEIAWRRVRHPAEVLQLGQTVQVKIVRIDPNQSRIGLSIKQCLPDPWQAAVERLLPGQTVEGVVTRIAPFGAFVDVGEGVEGLLPPSQLQGKGPVNEGDTIEVEILRVEPDRQRVGLKWRAFKTSAPAAP